MEGGKLKLKIPGDLRDQLESFVLPPFVRRGDPFSLYSKIGQIGKGSSGSVFKVILPNGLFKAVKIVNAGPHQTIEILKALKEAEIGMQIKHPHLLSIDEVWYDGTRFLFVMDLVEPLTVSSPDLALPFSLKDKKEILNRFQHIVSAVLHLYSMNILHRDIKVQNCGIKVDEDGNQRLVLFDFGEAFEFSDDSSGDCVGTILHIAPEVLVNCQYSDKSEIWALISFLIEFLTGKPMIYYFVKTGSRFAVESKISKLLDPLSESPIPEVFKTDKSPAGILLLHILERGLAINPAERLTFPELERLLQELIALL